jgi:hypothetical protein
VRVRFQLRKEPEWFLNWLIFYLHDRQESLYPGNYDSEYIAVRPDEPHATPSSQTSLTMTASLQGYNDSGMELGFKPVQFEVTTVFGEQTGVAVRVRNFFGLVDGFLKILMTAIADRWPEVLELIDVEKWQLHTGVDADTWTKWTRAVESLEAELGARTISETHPTTPEASPRAPLLRTTVVEQGDIRPAGENQAKGTGRGPGRPGLSRDELIYRLAKAQEGEQIKRDDPSMTWKEIALEIDWRMGAGKPGVKLLEDARKRLRRLEKHDPEGLLDLVGEFRKKKKEI